MSKKGFLNEIVDLDDPFTSFADELNDDAGSLAFVDTGSYILNAAFSTSIYGGIPNNKVTAFAGESAVGKSYFALGILKNFLSGNENAGGLYYETEGAPTQVIKARGLDGRRIVISQPSTIEEFKTNAIKVLNKYEELEEDERPPLMMVLDSLGQLSTIKEMDDSSEGNNVSDMTRTRAIKAAFRTITLKLSKLKVPFILTNHTYTAITQYGAPQVLSGGSGIKYAASTIAMLSRTKDKDEKTKEVTGNIIKCKMYKNRFAKENSEVEVRLSYKTGLDRYYGLLDLAVKGELYKKSTKGITLPDGTTTATKNIENEPEKYFTKDVLEKLDVIAKKEFSYGE
jgi:RecA/RadA recombinase